MFRVLALNSNSLLKKNAVIISVFIGLLTGISLLFWPGLYGPFFLDDLAHLSTPYHFSWPRLIENMMAHQSGPLGRPISIAILTLIQAFADQSPFVFKTANLILHGANALFILALSHSLLKLTGRANYLLSGFVTLIWFAHPIMVPTVLYPIQLMVILSTFFTLIALLTYLKARIERKLIWLVVSLLCTLLSAFSKEIGLLTIGYVFFIEYVFFMKSRSEKQKAHWLMLGLSLVATLGLYASQSWILKGYEIQAFDLPKRLESEPLVLLEYLKSTLNPTLYDIHLYQDDVLARVSISNSLTSTILLLCMFTSALYFRTKQALWFLLIICFFISQALESTLFALELKFIHRMYFASYFILFLVWDMLFLAMAKARPLLQKTVLPLLGVYLIYLGFITYSASVIFGDESLFDTMGEILHPVSLRAKSHALLQAESEGHYIGAERILDEMALLTPHQPAIRLERMILACWRGHSVSEAEIVPFIQEMQHAKITAYLINNLSHLMARNESQKCISETGLDTILEAVYTQSGNMHHALYRASILKLKARAALPQARKRIAAYLFQAAYYANPQDHDALIASLILNRNAFSENELRQKAFWLPALVASEMKE